jgi:hypothetical protein
VRPKLGCAGPKSGSDKASRESQAHSHETPISTHYKNLACPRFHDRI